MENKKVKITGFADHLQGFNQIKDQLMKALGELPAKGYIQGTGKDGHLVIFIPSTMRKVSSHFVKYTKV